MASDTRLSALDGLRGVAALVVVVHHSLLVSPALAAAYYGGDKGGTLHRIAIFTPLHLLWGGAEAVVLFFVLSGVVLVRAMRSPRFTLASYFPSRILRLWLPVVAAVAVGYAIITLLPRGDATASPWLMRDGGYPLPDVVRDLALVGGTSGVISPLWTLRWEILFSLLLPAFAYAARLIPSWAFGVVCLGLSAVGTATGVDALHFLPIFGVGIALAEEWDRLVALAERLPSRARGLAWTGWMIVAVAFTTSYWTLYSFLPAAVAHPIAQPFIVAGAAMLVFAAAMCAPLRHTLSWRPIAWLGAVSFSLYLIHEPIVLAFASMTGTARWTLLLAVPSALVVAWLFWWAAERPSHRIARVVRDRVTARERAAETARGRTEWIDTEFERELLRIDALR